MKRFVSSEYIPDDLLRLVIDARVQRPQLAFETAQRRKRRTALTHDGRLNIVAADHPARFVTNVGSNPLGMADRRDYLARILRVLSAHSVDGVMATMDIIEDLLILHAISAERGSASLLDNKLLIASLNRGGLAGASWELNDPITGALPKTCKEWALDGAKMLLRVDADEPASLKTMKVCAAAINECNAQELPIFLEPLPVRRSEKGFSVLKTPDAVARLVGVASALGDSSRNLWLKLPYTDDFATVARATTLPILLLGGESAGNPKPFLDQLERAMGSGYNVRGAMVGRNVVYPGDEDPANVATAVGKIIHEDWQSGRAAAWLQEVSRDAASAVSGGAE